MATSSPKTSSVVDALVIVALCSIALAQPFYDAIAGGSAFFVAHHVGAPEFALLLVAVSVLPSLIILALEAIAGIISPRLRQAVHLLAIWTLSAVFVIVVSNKLTEASVALTLVLALVIGGSLAALIQSSTPVRNILSIMSAGAIYFPALFLVSSPLSALLTGSGDEPPEQVIGSNPSVPVVVIIFDEMNPWGLLDNESRIDDVRFPNIATFAQEATWFRNAASVHPQSVKAVPAILTGMKPPEPETLPSFAGYPNNLITLLGRSYDLNILETFTALCPTTYCPTAGESVGKRFQRQAFASDLSVILGHIFLPRQLASEVLPKMNHGWKDFAGNMKNQGTGGSVAAPIEQVEANAKALAAERRHSFKGDRLGPFDTFLAGIKAGDSTLDMAHIVFPHTPYEYLPDMTRYNGESGNYSVWPDDQRLADESYKAYLMQLGAVDTLVGKLSARLKEVGKFDDALIVLVADHGRVFRQGEAQRALTTTTPDVLHTPLFIKLPGQKQQLVRGEFVFTVDVLPTIADALGIELPWATDGTSVLSNEFPKREDLSVFFNKINYTLTPAQIFNPNAIPGRVEKFGTRTALDTVHVKNEHDDLIGQRVAEAPVEPIPNAPRFVGNIGQLESINLTGDYLPLVFKGKIFGSGIENAGWIAMAVNGIVATLAPAYHKGEALEFSAFVPASALRNGSNEVSLTLIIEGENGARRLVPIQSPQSEVNYTISAANDGSTVVTAGERHVSIVEQRFKGGAGGLTVNGSEATIRGWIAEIKTGRVPLKVIAFVDEEFVGSALVNVARFDVSKRFSNNDILRSGFRLNIPLRALQKDAGGLRLFALISETEIVEMKVLRSLVTKVNETLAERDFASLAD